LSACGPAEDDARAEAENVLAAANATMRNAWTEQDAASVAALYADDAALLPPNAAPIEGRAAIESFWRDTMEAGLVVTPEDHTVRVGDSVAFKEGTYEIRSADGEVVDHGKYIEAWTRDEAGRWHLERDIWNSSVLPAAASPDPAFVAPEDIQWDVVFEDAVDFGSLYGDWDASAHGKMVRFQPGVASPPHRHSGAYHAVVVEGTVTNPIEGETSPVQMGPGHYWYVPGGTAHVTACVSDTPCLVYAHMDGAWDIEVIE
ncbi:MAG: SgcJ/EcaC family oxidoreductase, partial [Xanthomonadales bacterium]|nr:SgcJ/EcaC family oxidoreductase [Xanthomonadales bacterium]